MFCLVIILLVLGKGALSLLVLGVLGEEVYFLGCSETPAIDGETHGKMQGRIIKGCHQWLILQSHSRVYLQG